MGCGFGRSDRENERESERGDSVQVWLLLKFQFFLVVALASLALLYQNYMTCNILLKGRTLFAAMFVL